MEENSKPPYDSIARIVYEEDQDRKRDLRDKKRRKAPWE
jgi:hypothetical protein